LVTNIQFDIHVLPGTPTDTNGNFGAMNVGLKSITYQADTAFYTNLVTIPGAATNGWVTLHETNAAQFQYAALNSGDTNAQGVEFYYTQYGPPTGEAGYPTNVVTFWIDNVIVNTSAAPPPPPPPPVVTIAPAVAGLNLFMGTGIGLYNRESIEADQSEFSWVGASSAVSYSFTISSYPVAPTDAVQNHIFLCPTPGTENDPDWEEPNIIFLDMENATNGAIWNFRYKTNQPNGNSMLYGNGTLAIITNKAGAIGKWTATFNNATNITLITPDGSTTNFSIPDTTGDTTSLFSNGVALYYGAQAGNAGATGDHIVASEFSVTGLGGSDFDDNFVADDGSLNSVWTINAAYPTSVQVVSATEPFWVQWGPPANNFTLQTASDLTPPVTWTPVTANTVFTAGTNFTQLINATDLLGGRNGYFSLIQP
jgi:hypothetical protein